MSDPRVRKSPWDGSEGTGRRLYPLGPKSWKSEGMEVVWMAVTLYEASPRVDSKALSFVEPFIPPKVKYHRASEPAMNTFSFSL